MKEKRICKRCGKEFEIYSCLVRVGGGKYCSRKCTNFHIEKKCIYCGKQYKVRRNRKDISKYYSTSCHTKHQHELSVQKRICKNCGKEFFISTGRLNSGKGQYCSLFCANQSPIRKKHCKKSALLAYQKPRKRPVCASPNKDEIKLNNIIQGLNLPYKFVGNGEIWITGLNPDFINVNGQKKIIELFGEPWHGKRCFHFEKPSFSRTEQGRKHIFSQYGYDTLIIWCRELREPKILKHKILDFDGTGG